MSDEQLILTDSNLFCPECNAILTTDEQGDKTCPNGCELIEYLD